MKALEIWSECRRASIRLTVNGDKLSYRSRDAAAVDRMLPLMKRYKAELLACAKELQGLPVEDGPFMPWGPYLTRQLLDQWQRELYESVLEVGKLENWTTETFDLVLSAIERQPISTLRPDLAHFRERLEEAKEERERDMRR